MNPTQAREIAESCGCTEPTPKDLGGCDATGGVPGAPAGKPSDAAMRAARDIHRAIAAMQSADWCNYDRTLAEWSRIIDGYKFPTPSASPPDTDTQLVMSGLREACVAAHTAIDLAKDRFAASADYDGCAAMRDARESCKTAIAAADRWRAERDAALKREEQLYQHNIAVAERVLEACRKPEP